eukprot:Pgem_evm1s5691
MVSFLKIVALSSIVVSKGFASKNEKLLYEIHTNAETWVHTMEIDACAKKDIEKMKNFAQVTILGTARQGKSTLMGVLAKDDPTLFPTDPSETESFTKGARYADELVNMGNTSALFVDFEGQDFKTELSEAYDARLTTPALITSEVVLYNFNVFNPDTINEKLDLIAERLEKIVLKNGQKLGHLHLTFQKLPLDERQGIEDKLLLTTKEDFLNALKRTTESELIVRRRYNERARIRNKFKSVSIWCIPDQSKELENIDQKVFTKMEQFSADYVNIVDQLRDRITFQINMKDSKHFNGELYIQYMEKIKNQINSGDQAFDVMGIKEQTILEKCLPMLNKTQTCISNIPYRKVESKENMKKLCAMEFFKYIEQNVKEFPLLEERLVSEIEKDFTEMLKKYNELKKAEDIAKESKEAITRIEENIKELESDFKKSQRENNENTKKLKELLLEQEMNLQNAINNQEILLDKILEKNIMAAQEASQSQANSWNLISQAASGLSGAIQSASMVRAIHQSGKPKKPTKPTENKPKSIEPKPTKPEPEPKPTANSGTNGATRWLKPTTWKNEVITFRDQAAQFAFGRKK